MLCRLSRTRVVALLVAILGLEGMITQGQKTTCRQGRDKAPHQQSIWQADFPVDSHPEALCEGSITVTKNGDICIDGRVSYRQISEFLEKPIFSPAADTISVNGHLITGSANVYLGTKVKFLVDFVKEYTIDGTTHKAWKDIINNTLAASKGLISGLCLDKSIAEASEDFYSIKHKFWFPGSADEQEMRTANIIYVSAYSVVAEYWEYSNYSPYFGTITNTIAEFGASIVPSVVFKWIPLLGTTGLFRYTVTGSVATTQFPQGITAPPVTVENVQIDTEWETLLLAMEDGLFTEHTVPLYMGVLVKRVEPAENTNGCWKNTTAAIDIQAPTFRGDDLDKYIKDTVLPALKARGTVGVHFGKRLDSGSEILKTALDTYKKCGVMTYLDPPERCWHPACQRSSVLTGFEYPSRYYQPSKIDEDKRW